MYQCKNRCNLKHTTFSMSGLLIGLVTILTCEILLLAPPLPHTSSCSHSSVVDCEAHQAHPECLLLSYDKILDRHALSSKSYRTFYLPSRFE